MSQIIFEKLVRGPDDLEGMVAFSLYTAQEHEWLEQHRARNNGQNPSTDALRTFIEAFTPAGLERLRGDARNTLTQFAVDFLEDNIEEERRKAVNQSILKEVKKHNSFGMNALASAAGSFLFGVVLLVLFAIAVRNPSVQDFITRMFDPPAASKSQ